LCSLIKMFVFGWPRISPAVPSPPDGQITAGSVVRGSIHPRTHRKTGRQFQANTSRL
jgi:hypothetical protein